MYTLFQTLCGVVISATLNMIRSVWDFVKAQTHVFYDLVREEKPRSVVWFSKTNWQESF